MNYVFITFPGACLGDRYILNKKEESIMGLKDSESRNFRQAMALSENFPSIYNGKCSDCTRKIKKGDFIHKTADGYAHEDCNEIKRSEGAGFGRRTGGRHLGAGGHHRHKP